LPLTRSDFLLPEDVAWRQAAQLGHPQAGIEQRPDDEFLIRGLAGMTEPIGFFRA